MKLEVLENGLKIVPETYQDVAFLELKLGLKKDGDLIFMARVQENEYGAFFIYGHDSQSQIKYDQTLISNYLGQPTP